VAAPREDADVAKRRRGGVQEQPLSIDDVVAAALRVTGRVGLDGLTVRLVAEELEVSPPAVHYHVPGKNELINRVCEAVAAEIDLDVDTTAPWQDQYVELVLAMDRTLSRYPGVALRTLTATGTSAAARDLATAALTILRRGDLPAGEAELAFASSQYLLTGWLVLRPLGDRGEVQASLAAAGIPGPAAGTTGQLDAAVRRLLAGFR
jgi:TetR/AcrR family transcriptional regulator, tetracycline repressor protein